ncbi:MAG: NAD(P)/FAD-dependent oxidoreductase [Schwartzia sp.]|jgi:NADPH-dependent 2,4-dienoyl-CoA reductase/sulfur reductase-like enzyme|uniref:NAD(P)/FAD-dependent oxidoreductase n=1 Tax=Schwartzia succinivorans TaxID=55507 RepID=UPI0023578111|nr:NAD(P)/FAD-dependent oxidoreductase [Schwartzia succinivorans]MBQ1470613.1 FAD-dependent oxidoreductase [Schwartzia sp. (in: firmicutes)]MBE6097281.1 FAD-dependent oxidoreductase [Schwartzia succinivorans]MBQ3863865.1 FAD-dependent oxidoreductase [Schwartzia sp. (in: firmicutes)]MBQ4152321.1 FAD-dependent oxidoreductase [Schwartzia sp. (in: firmicutes)]MBQ5414236.1 FAD-dependent oxidoreductase [Schwartzia sp. (in: firmicutes)]
MSEMYDIIIVGGGPAGLSAAHSAVKNGAKKIIVLERDREAGGILQQCVHNGFGLHHFKEELTGPGYAQRCYDLIKDCPEVEVLVDTMVLEVHDNKEVIAVNPERGLMKLQAKTVILTMGCRERTRGAIRIPGYRPAGVYTAGAAQRMVNMEGYIPGHKIVILGSGDIGLIMARRMSLEGCKVQAVLEICPFSNGLTRNIVQCLNDYDIPLYLSHTITGIKGKDRVEGITVSKVDDKMRPIPGTEFDIECDTVLLSVGLIPENEISRELGIELHPRTNGPVVDQHRETSMPGIFAAGNVVHVHDLVDFVSDEAEIAGKYAALTALGKNAASDRDLAVTPGAGVNTCVPQHLRLSSESEAVRLFMRAAQPKRKVKLSIMSGGQEVMKKILPVVKPSEMISVEIPAEKTAALSDDITVSIEEA